MTLFWSLPGKLCPATLDPEAFKKTESGLRMLTYFIHRTSLVLRGQCKGLLFGQTLHHIVGQGME
jgi:hypothetical protein